MKVTNIQRAIEASKELKELEIAIKELDRFGTDGFLIQNYEDGSGISVNIQYTRGDFHYMYSELIALITNRFIDARNELIEEIEKL